MALAFKRASSAADEKIKGYFSTFRDTYKLTAEPPISFDWESAKAIEGSSPHNANKEELPKAITICNFIAGYPNYLASMFSKLGSLASGNDDIVWPAMHKHWKGVLVHFDEKGTTPGKVNWALNEVKDGVLHVTMKWNFSGYTGNANTDEIGEATLTWLEDAENLRFQIVKAKALKAGASTNFNNNTHGFIKSKLGDSAMPLVVNWDEIAATPGRFVEYSNKPPERASYLLAMQLVDGQLTLAIRTGLEHVLKDKDGMEAFAETFKEIKINLSAGTPSSLSASKAGSSLVFTMVVDMSNHHNAQRSFDGKALGKAIEGML